MVEFENQMGSYWELIGFWTNHEMQQFFNNWNKLKSNFVTFAKVKIVPYEIILLRWSTYFLHTQYDKADTVY